LSSSAACLTCSAYSSTLKTKAVRFFEKSINFYQTKRHRTAQDSTLHRYDKFLDCGLRQYSQVVTDISEKHNAFTFRVSPEDGGRMSLRISGTHLSECTVSPYQHSLSCSYRCVSLFVRQESNEYCNGKMPWPTSR
jgi:hypothetical protein